MAAQAQIVSFDDVKRVHATRSTRVRSYGSGRARTAESAPSASSLPGRPGMASRAHERRAHPSTFTQGSGGFTADRTFDARFPVAQRRSTSYASVGSAAAPLRSDPFGGIMAPRSTVAGAPRSRRADSLRNQEARAYEADDDVSKDDDSWEHRARDRKRRREKARAERLFEKQFGASGAVSDDAGPRAAVYKTEMGRKQRQANRMQSSGTAPSLGSAASGIAGGISAAAEKVRSTPKLLVALVTVACVLLVCLFLYQPAQQYYQSVRENARLEAEYAAVLDRNASLSETNAALQSDAGIETELRDRYNYVKSGEQTANVSGLADSDASASVTANVAGNISTGSVSTPTTWYSPVLDVVFGYHD